jgi:hypothetical protein
VSIVFDGIRPDVDADGVPLCSEEGCAQYDGKRCRELGQRPGRICEPGVRLMASLIRMYEGALKKAVTP